MARTDKDTERQIAARNRLRTLHLAWRNMSETERKTWRSAAQNQSFVNRLGLSRKMSGKQLFAKINLPRVAVDIPQFVEPPMPVLTPPPYDLTFTVALPNNYIISWEHDQPTWMHFIRLFTARTMSGTLVKPIKHWRFTWVASPPWETGNIKTYFDNQWGVPLVGEFVAVALQVWNTDMLPSPFVEATTFVTWP